MDKRYMFLQDQMDDLIEECEKILDRIDRLTKIEEDLREEVMALRDQVIVAKGDIYL